MILPMPQYSGRETKLTQMTTGQLYRVGLTCIAAHERCELELLIVASSNDEAKAKLPWVYDFSGFSSYRVDWTVKEPGKCVVIKTKFTRTPENEPDANIKRLDGSQALFQKSPIAAAKKYQVAAATTLYAKSPEHAIKKLNERISGGSEFVKVTCEELHASSGFAVARDQSVFPRASMVRG